METKREVKFLRFVLDLTIAIFLIIIYRCIKNQIDFEKIFDITILTSFCVVFTIDLLSDVIFYWYKNKTEDKTKLNSNYIELNKKYQNKKFEYVNTDNQISAKMLQAKELKIDENEENKLKFTFPIIFECDLRDKKIKFNDNQIMYRLPYFILKNASQLLEAHSTSKHYNNLTIRVRDWHIEKNEFIIDTERTTYYKTLLTNRCMDFKLQKNLSVREVLEYGPYLSPLSESKLSNHLGFNAFVKTSDNWIPLIKRKSDLTDGKHTYGLSVQASIKTKYTLDDKLELNNQAQLYNCMHQEISDELGIPKESILSKTNCVYAAYRDIREGGKPQLFAFFDLNIKKEELTNYFTINIKKKKYNDNLLYDGNSIVWIKADSNIESQIAISPSMIFYKNKKLLMTPSSAACVAFAMIFGLLK